MRRGRETLLTLLEAFVYDPLVEWGGGGGGGKRRRTQRDVRAALAMMAVRAQELKHSLEAVTEQFLAVLPDIKDAADNWLKEHEELVSVETRLKDCHQQMTLIKEIEAYGSNLNNHPLYAISQKYSSYKQAKNAVDDSQKALVKILKDFDTQIENFANTAEVINGPQLMAWVQEFSGPDENEDAPIFEHIREFLTNAGQSSMISQCEAAEAELYQTMKNTHLLIRACLELLSQHVAVSQYFPQSHTEYHRIAMFRKFLAAALESKSPEVCREVSSQVNALVNSENNKADSSQQIVAYNYRLQTMNAEANASLTKAIERLQLEGGPDALVLAQEAYREAKANVGNWVRTEEGAASALESVVIGMLCALNRRYLMLENGAQSAGDCLVDLTSREGEWFLDDMSGLSMQAVELLSLLPLQSASAEDAAMSVAVECVRNANLLLADLVQLNYNFSTIILPEALKKIHSEDPSVLLMINELNAVIMNTPVPLNDLLQQLEMHLRYLIMDMESPANTAQLLAAELRQRYEALLTAPNTEVEGQAAGRMLLMGFNGLFASVELRARELADHLAIPISPAWRKIDHISESMHMSAALQSPVFRAVLEDIFLVRRVQTVAEVFAMCAQMACAFKGAGPAALFDDAALCKPVRRFTAEYVSRCVLGVHSKALASVLCLLLRRARLDLHAEVEQKEIGASWSVSLESLCEKVCGSGVLGNNQDTSGALARRSRELAAAVERLTAATNKAHGLLTAAHQRTLSTALHHWEKACTLAQKYALNVSPVEEALMEMLHPEGNIDTQWVENVSALLREMISQLTTDIGTRKSEVRTAWSALRSRVESLAAPAAARAQLAADVRAPLHVLQQANQEDNPAVEYVALEKKVVEQLKAISSVRDELGAVRAAAQAAHALLDHLPALHAMLLDLHKNWPSEINGRKLTRQTAVTTPAQRNACPNRQARAERSAVGAGVWKRVRLKLEGRDPDPARRPAPALQVEHIVSEATHPDNLCLMYEGWMAWV
ncbi:hypothetical protein O3G_MSEX014455 [Manduca sexta]|nr:hypothetical protein O3G_MSEX014455 [Manduca sexta]